MDINNLIGSSSSRKRSGVEKNYKPFVHDLTLGRNYEVFDNLNTVQYKAAFLILLGKVTDEEGVKVSEVIRMLSSGKSGIKQADKIVALYNYFKNADHEIMYNILNSFAEKEYVTNMIRVLSVYAIFYDFDFDNFCVSFAGYQKEAILKYKNR